MTIKPEVLAAMDQLDDLANAGEWLTSDDIDAAKMIRAELLAMDAEIADLISKRDFLLRHYNDAESRLAAADGLLRQATEWNWLDEPVEEMNALAQKIEQHLYGSAMHNSAREVGE